MTPDDHILYASRIAGYAARGERVAVFARKSEIARFIMGGVKHWIDAVGALKRHNLPAMRLETKRGGRINFFSIAQIDAPRGKEYDLVYVDDYASQRLFDNVVPCVMRTNGEIIRFCDFVLKDDETCP